jgi:hypothetical protein
MYGRKFLLVYGADLGQRLSLKRLKFAPHAGLPYAMIESNRSFVDCAEVTVLSNAKLAF